MSHCDYENCINTPEFICKCSRASPKFCDMHISQHLKTEAKHKPKSLILQDQKIKKIRIKVGKINESLSALSASLEKEKDSILKKISEKYDNCIKKLKSKQKKLKNDLESPAGISASSNYINLLINLSEQDLKNELKSWSVPKIMPLLPSLNKALNSFTILNENFPPYYQNFSTFLWVNLKKTPGIYKFDFGDQIIIDRLKVLEKFSYSNSCQISNDLIFISVGKSNLNKKEKIFFYCSENSEITKIKKSGFEGRNMAGTVFCNFEIFIFGGVKIDWFVNGEFGSLDEESIELIPEKSWESLVCKYNLISKEWIRVSDLPFPSEVSSILIDKNFQFDANNEINRLLPINSENLILLTGFQMSKVYIYNPSYDKYEETGSVLESKKFKTLLKHQKKIFLLYNKTIFLQKPSKNTWKKIGYFTFLKECHISHQITRKDSVIFTNNSQIWSFNTNKNEITELQPPQTHYIFHTNTNSPYKKQKISLT